MTDRSREIHEIFAVLCVGKTGGTSLSNLLYKTFGSPQCFREMQHLAFNLLGHFYRDQLELYLRSMASEHFRGMKIIVGHIPVGLGSAFPGARFRYMTILREPISRLVSTYFYINQNHPRTDVDYLNAEFHRAISSGGDVVYSDPMTRVFTGSEDLVPRELIDIKQPITKVTEEDLEQAIHNLRSFEFVGLTECLRDSTKLIFEKLGSKFNGDVPRDNVTNITLRVPQVHPDTISLLRRYTRLDQKLYAEGVHIYNRHAIQAGLPTYEYKIASSLCSEPISSGDHCHLTSAAAAMSQRADGIWVGSNPRNRDGEWLGMEFARDYCCRALCIQLPNEAGGGAVGFQLEASNDEFNLDVIGIAQFTIPANGEVHQIVVAGQHIARYWRVRSLHRSSPGPLKIAYLGLNTVYDKSPRDMNAVRNCIETAQLILGFDQ